jgi:hypothetical protein
MEKELIQRKNELNRRKLQLNEELIKADELLAIERTKTGKPVFINPEVNGWETIKTAHHTKFIKKCDY